VQKIFSEVVASNGREEVNIIKLFPPSLTLRAGIIKLFTAVIYGYGKA
jgi:hypothetical protein